MQPKKSLPTHDPEPEPPEDGNLQALFAERVNAVSEPVAEALRTAFLLPLTQTTEDRKLPP